MKHKFLHKCRVFKDQNGYWVVSDKECGEFTETKTWRRALLIGVYHFQDEMASGIARVLKALK